MPWRSACLCGSLILVSACHGGPPALTTPNPLPGLSASPAARAHRVERTAELHRGRFASGRVGDFRLDNGLVAFIVGELSSEAPGAILDAAPPGREDALRRLSPAVGQPLTPPQIVSVDAPELAAGASIRLTGHDASQPAVEISTICSLDPGVRYLRLETTVTNRGADILRQYQVGDLIDWGEAEVYAPGLGLGPRGRPALSWLGAWSERVSYGYYRGGGELATDLSGPTTSVVLATVELKPGESASVRRELAVGQGGQVAEVLGIVYARQGVTTGSLEATVVSDDDDSLPWAVLQAEAAGKPIALARTGDDGSAVLQLPPGHYRVTGGAPDRLARPIEVEIIGRQTTSATIEAGPPSRLVFEVRAIEAEGDAVARLVPARLTLVGVDSTPTPWLGPSHRALARNVVLTGTGTGSLPLPPGRYRVVVSHGPEYSVHSEEVTLRPRAGASLVARLRRVVQTGKYVAVDPGERSAFSPGCAVSLEDRILSDLTDGIAVVVSSDENRAQGWRETPHRGVLVIPGLAGWSTELGSYTVFPLRPGTEEAEWSQTTAGQPLVQLDAARRLGTGLLARANFDPASARPELIPPAASALRLLDAEHPEDFEALLQDWLALLRRGRRLTATAASQSRAIAAGAAGFPRLYVESEPAPSPASIADAIRKGRAVVSSGPFIQLRVDGQGPGSTVALARSAKLTPRRRGSKAAAPPSEITVDVEVWAPAWIGLDHLTLLVNGRPWQKPLAIAGRADGSRLKQTLTVPITGDAFVVAIVRGTSPLSPVVETPGAPLLPLAVTNPVWIDADGDGHITLPPGDVAAASQPAR